MPPAPGKAELEIATIVAELGEATVRQVLDKLPGERDIDFNTVQTYMRRLETKGFLKSRRVGRCNVYTPVGTLDHGVREHVAGLIRRLFPGSVFPFVQHLLTDQRLTKGEVKRIRELLDRHEREARDD
jgi:BlaI family transcriptional regulator, penicillinase repressor